MITIPIHEGEARVRGQLAYDNPDCCHGTSILYHRKMNEGRVYHVWRKFKREYIMSGGNLSGVYHFYTMAVTAATMV